MHVIKLWYVNSVLNHNFNKATFFIYQIKENARHSPQNAQASRDFALRPSPRHLLQDFVKVLILVALVSAATRLKPKVARLPVPPVEEGVAKAVAEDVEEEVTAKEAVAKEKWIETCEHLSPGNFLPLFHR